MAYVLGFLYADGSLEDAPYLRGRYVRVSSVDEDIVLKIKKWLRSEHRVLTINPGLHHGKTRYFLRIGSHRLYDMLTHYGLYPNKSLSMEFPDIPRHYLSDFVRGYFDGDGCVYLATGVGKKKQRIIKRLRVIFTSGSKMFLERLCSILEDAIDLKGGKVYKSHRSFQLYYPTSDSVRLFEFLYNNVPPSLYFKRKFEIFQEYFSLRNIKTSMRIARNIKVAMWRNS